jgi:hypothetical protein
VRDARLLLHLISDNPHALVGSSNDDSRMFNGCRDAGRCGAVSFPPRS